MRLAAIAALRSSSRVGAGHSSAIASSDAPPAMPQPASRSGIALLGAASVTGRMNASSNDAVVPASTELTTPAKSTPNATAAVTTAPSTSDRETRVASDTSTPAASTSAA